MEKKRIKCRLKSPNPLFEQWLNELYLTALSKSDSVHVTYKKALQSLKRYPLVLKSGSECVILNGFGRKLCDTLDKKLSEHTAAHSSSAETKFESNSTSESEDRVAHVNDEEMSFCSENVTQRKSLEYAVLLTLLKESQKLNSSYVPKSTLERKIQKHCDVLRIGNNSKLNVSIWQCINDLIEKDLIDWKMDSDLFSLTNTGENLAIQFLSSEIESSNSKKGSDTEFNKVKSDIKETNMPKMNEIEQLTTSNSQNVFEINKHSLNISPTKSVKQINMAKTNVIEQSTASNSRNMFEINKHSSNTSPSKSKENQIRTVFIPGTFDIILLVDSQEISGRSNKSDPTLNELKKYTMIQYELRSLKVGDFAWIARQRSGNEELVLPYIVERKRMDDLSHSIKDGRFHEQKFRLKQCGIPNIIYLIEHFVDKRPGLPTSTLMQAAINTRVQNDFTTHFTSSLADSIKFLAMMTKNIQEKYENKILQTGTEDSVDGVDNTVTLMRFQDFNQSSVKNRNLSVSDMFIKQLLQMKGISIEKALEITSVHKTPFNLMNAYENGCDPESLLNAAANKKSNSKVGQSINKLLHKYYTDDVLN